MYTSPLACCSFIFTACARSLNRHLLAESVRVFTIKHFRRCCQQLVFNLVDGLLVCGHLTHRNADQPTAKNTALKLSADSSDALALISPVLAVVISSASLRPKTSTTELETFGTGSLPLTLLRPGPTLDPGQLQQLSLILWREILFSDLGVNTERHGQVSWPRQEDGGRPHVLPGHGRNQ